MSGRTTKKERKLERELRDLQRDERDWVQKKKRRKDDEDEEEEEEEVPITYESICNNTRSKQTRGVVAPLIGENNKVIRTPPPIKVLSYLVYRIPLDIWRIILAHLPGDYVCFIGSVDVGTGPICPRLNPLCAAELCRRTVTVAVSLPCEIRIIPAHLQTDCRCPERHQLAPRGRLERRYCDASQYNALESQRALARADQGGLSHQQICGLGGLAHSMLLLDKAFQLANVKEEEPLQRYIWYLYYFHCHVPELLDEVISKYSNDGHTLHHLLALCKTSISQKFQATRNAITDLNNRGATVLTLDRQIAPSCCPGHLRIREFTSLFDLFDD